MSFNIAKYLNTHKNCKVYNATDELFTEKVESRDIAIGMQSPRKNF